VRWVLLYTSWYFVCCIDDMNKNYETSALSTILIWMKWMKILCLLCITFIRLWIASVCSNTHTEASYRWVVISWTNFTFVHAFTMMTCCENYEHLSWMHLSYAPNNEMQLPEKWESKPNGKTYKKYRWSVFFVSFPI